MTPAATATLYEKREQGNQLKPAERPATVVTDRPSGDDVFPPRQPVDKDVKKRSNRKAEKEHDNAHTCSMKAISILLKAFHSLHWRALCAIL